MSGLQFAVYITGDPSPEAAAKYVDYGQLFLRLLSQPGDSWQFFDVRNFEYPIEVTNFHAIIITGSPATANEPIPWIIELKNKIMEAYQQKVKLVGVCFGHQVIAEAMGGATAINPKGWEVGTFPLAWKNDGYDPLLVHVPTLPHRVLQVHRDVVVIPPKDARVLASSALTDIQVYCVGKSILGIQGHPEFFNDIVGELVKLRIANGLLSKDVASSAITSLEELPDRTAWVDFIRVFLKL